MFKKDQHAMRVFPSEDLLVNLQLQVPCRAVREHGAQSAVGPAALIVGLSVAPSSRTALAYARASASSVAVPFLLLFLRLVLVHRSVGVGDHLVKRLTGIKVDRRAAEAYR